MNELPDFKQPLWFLAAVFIIFVVVTGRYFLIAGLFYGIFYLWFPQKWQQ
jgi:lathosterol oxidase